MAQQIAQQEIGAREKRRIVASEKRVMAKHDDYQDKYRTFLGIIGQEPWLWDRIVDAAEPAEEMYRLVVERQTYGANPQEWEKKKEAEIRAKVEAELRGQKAQQAVAGATPTQAGARSAGPNAAQPAPQAGHILDDVFRDY